MSSECTVTRPNCVGAEGANVTTASMPGPGCTHEPAKVAGPAAPLSLPTDVRRAVSGVPLGKPGEVHAEPSLVISAPFTPRVPYHVFDVLLGVVGLASSQPRKLVMSAWATAQDMAMTPAQTARRMLSPSLSSDDETETSSPGPAARVHDTRGHR